MTDTIHQANTPASGGDELREALKPFAALADEIEDASKRTGHPVEMWAPTCAWEDLARARAALAAQPPKPDGGVVPTGWKCVPEEPTEAMIAAGTAGRNSVDSILARPNTLATYTAMLAAAPPLNTGPEVGGGGEDLREAATMAAMYLRTGFINCERCGHEQPTKDTDAQYALDEALARPTPAASRPAVGREEIARVINPETFRHGSPDYYGPDEVTAWCSAGQRIALRRADQILAILAPRDDTRAGGDQAQEGGR